MLVFPATLSGKADDNQGAIILYSYGPARVQIKAPDGSRAGTDLVTGAELEEISGSDVRIERAVDRSDGYTVTLKSPEPGVYLFEVLGTGTGGVVLDLEAHDSSGRISSSHIFRRIRAGDFLGFVLDYRSDSRSGNRLEELSR